MSKNSSPERKFILRNVILSYANVLVPKADDKGVLKYSAAFVTTPTTNVSELEKAELAAANDKWGAKAAGMLADGSLKSTWRRRTPADRTKYPGAPHGYVNARSDNKPGIVGVFAGPDGKPLPLQDPKVELYSGCMVNVLLYAFPYDMEMNRGVSFGLNHIQKVADGARLDGRGNAEDEFDADLSAVPASLNDLK